MTRYKGNKDKYKTLIKLYQLSIKNLKGYYKRKESGNYLLVI